MFDQTNDAEHFQPAKVWQRKGYKLEGNVYTKRKKRALPLYEAKMVQAFDHRAASVVIDSANWFRQGQTQPTNLVDHQNPEFSAMPRWWVEAANLESVLGDRLGHSYLCFKSITSPTNQRTMIAAMIPNVGMVNSAPVILFGRSIGARQACCLLANLNSFVLDFVARQKVGNVNLNFFIVEQLPTLPPDVYDDKCPWSKKETLEDWISERVLKLSRTAEDMIPLAKACNFKGSRGDGVHLWKEAERGEIRAELDAAYFHLYGIARKDVEYILSTFSNTGVLREGEGASQQVLWRRHSTGEMVLDAYDRFQKK
jgi:hypothetical protein